MSLFAPKGQEVRSVVKTTSEEQRTEQKPQVVKKSQDTLARHEADQKSKQDLNLKKATFDDTLKQVKQLVAERVQETDLKKATSVLLAALADHQSAEAFRDTITLLKDQVSKGILSTGTLKILIQDYFDFVKKNASMETLRDAVTTLNPLLAFDEADKRALSKLYLDTMTTLRSMGQISHKDVPLMVDALGRLFKNDPGSVKRVLTNFFGNLAVAENTLQNLPLNRALIKERIDALHQLHRELSQFVLPDHGLDKKLWKRIVAPWETHKELFKPLFMKLDPASFKEYVLKITPSQEKMRSLNMADSLKRLREYYDFYADFPLVQQALLANAKDAYRAFTGEEEKHTFLRQVALDQGLQEFFNTINKQFGLFGYNKAEVDKPSEFTNELYRFALNEEGLKKDDYSYLLNLSPALFTYPLLTTAVSIKPASFLYDDMNRMPDKQFAALLDRIALDTYMRLDVPILFEAVADLNPIRAKVLLDAFRMAKQVFEKRQASKPSLERRAFPVSEEALKNASAETDKRMKALRTSEQKPFAWQPPKFVMPSMPSTTLRPAVSESTLSKSVSTSESRSTSSASKGISPSTSQPSLSQMVSVLESQQQTVPSEHVSSSSSAELSMKPATTIPVETMPGEKTGEPVQVAVFETPETIQEADESEESQEESSSRE
jgi:hypothetical protein